MSKQYSDKTIAAKVASIIRKSQNSRGSGSIAIDWTDTENQKNIDDCRGQVADIDPILRDNFSDVEIFKRLKAHIDELFQRFVGAGVTVIGTQEQQEIADTIKYWRANLAAQHELRTYYAIVDGVSIDEKLSIGLVNISPLTPYIEKRIISQFVSRLRRSPNFTKQRKRELISHFKMRASEFFKEKESVNSVVVSTVVDTWDDEIGRKEAFERFEETTNFIRYMGYLFSPPPGRIGVSLRGELGYEGKTILGMSDRVIYNQYFSAHHYPVALSKNRLIEAKTILEVLKIPFSSRNEFEHKMVSAVNWIGKGCVEASSGDQLVSFCIALEVLLKGDVRIGYTNIVSERISFLLPSEIIRQFTYKGISCERDTFYELIREIFQSRGDVVHEGNPHIDSQSPRINRAVAFILYAVLKTLRTLYKRNRWSETKPLFDLLTKRKYGLSPLPKKQP